MKFINICILPIETHTHPPTHTHTKLTIQKYVDLKRIDQKDQKKSFNLIPPRDVQIWAAQYQNISLSKETKQYYTILYNDLRFNFEEN